MSNAYFYVRILHTSVIARAIATRGKTTKLRYRLLALFCCLLSRLSRIRFSCLLSFIRFVIPRKIFHVRSDVSVHASRRAQITHVTYQIYRSKTSSTTCSHTRISCRNSTTSLRFAQVVSRVDHFFRVWVSRRLSVFRQASIAPVAATLQNNVCPSPDDGLPR